MDAARALASSPKRAARVAPPGAPSMPPTTYVYMPQVSLADRVTSVACLLVRMLRARLTASGVPALPILV